MSPASHWVAEYIAREHMLLAVTDKISSMSSRFHFIFALFLIPHFSLHLCSCYNGLNVDEFTFVEYIYIYDTWQVSLSRASYISSVKSLSVNASCYEFNRFQPKNTISYNSIVS